MADHYPLLITKAVAGIDPDTLGESRHRDSEELTFYGLSLSAHPARRSRSSLYGLLRGLNQTLRRCGRLSIITLACNRLTLVATQKLLSVRNAR